MARMKRKKSTRRVRGAKQGAGTAKARGGGKPQTVDEYLAGVAEPGRGALREMRAAIRSAVPAEASEIISYRIPAFRYRIVLVWYAAFAKHCSLFPTAAVIDEFKDDLRGYTVSKGTIQFPLGEPLPVGLIKRLVRARVAAVERGK